MFLGKSGLAVSVKRREASSKGKITELSVNKGPLESPEGVGLDSFRRSGIMFTATMRCVPEQRAGMHGKNRIHQVSLGAGFYGVNRKRL